MEVPRSGCLAIRATGTASSVRATRKSVTVSCPSRRWNHQASTSGVASLSISLGWITVNCRSSQRVAPLRVTPNSSVAVSNMMPKVYSGTAICIRRCGGSCATKNITIAASTMLRPWSTKRVPWS